jgi:hypothetical protein
MTQIFHRKRYTIRGPFTDLGRGELPSSDDHPEAGITGGRLVVTRPEQQHAATRLAESRHSSAISTLIAGALGAWHLSDMLIPAMLRTGKNDNAANRFLRSKAWCGPAMRQRVPQRAHAAVKQAQPAGEALNASGD